MKEPKPRLLVSESITRLAKILIIKHAIGRESGELYKHFNSAEICGACGTAMTLSIGIKEYAYDIGSESHCYLCAHKAWLLSLLIPHRISVTQYERLILSCKHNQPAGISWQTPIHPISIKQRPNLINVLTLRSVQWMFSGCVRSARVQLKVQEKLDSRTGVLKWRIRWVFHSSIKSFEASVLSWPHE